MARAPGPVRDDALRMAADLLEQNAGQDSRVQNTESGASEDEAALRIDIDQQKAESFGVSVPAVNSMLSTIFSGTEVNDFALGAQLRPVVVQGRAENRMQPEDVDSWLAGIAGYMLDACQRPERPSSPHLRTHGRWYAEAAWSWLALRRGWTR